MLLILFLPVDSLIYFIESIYSIVYSYFNITIYSILVSITLNITYPTVSSNLYTMAYLDCRLFIPNDVPLLNNTSISKFNKDVDFITKILSLFDKYFLYDIEFFLNTV